MKTILAGIHVSSCRYRGVVWVLLFTFLCTLFPFPLYAQQFTATISSLTGIVLVNGQDQGEGTVLNARDMIETQAGASVIITLSDGGILDVGEKTQIHLAELRQTATHVRVSRIKLMWGWMRARLSPGHQQIGSSFDIETPNALIGVKFSQPDVEVSYDPAKQETVALALTVELAVKNLITDEEMLIPVGSMAVITTVGITIMAGAAAAGTIAGTTGTATTVGTAATGLSTGTMVAIGAGTLAVAGGITAVAVSSDGGGGSEETDTYSVSDLDGTWLGDLTFTPVSGNTGDSRIEEGIGFSFDAQGNVVNGTGPGGGFSSLSGNLTVSQAGELRGTLYAVIIVNSADNVIDTTTIKFEGHFTSANRMNIVLTATYARNDGTGGSYILSGDLIRQ